MAKVVTTVKSQKNKKIVIGTVYVPVDIVFFL